MNLLKQAEKVLSPLYYVETSPEGFLHVSTSENMIPFAIVGEEDYKLVIAFNIIPEMPMMIADFMLSLIYIANIDLDAPFYISKVGHIYRGEDALNQMDLEENIDLNTIVPISNLKN